MKKADQNTLTPDELDEKFHSLRGILDSCKMFVVMATEVEQEVALDSYSDFWRVVELAKKELDTIQTDVEQKIERQNERKIVQKKAPGEAA